MNGLLLEQRAGSGQVDKTDGSGRADGLGSGSGVDKVDCQVSQNRMHNGLPGAAREINAVGTGGEVANTVGAMQS